MTGITVTAHHAYLRAAAQKYADSHPEAADLLKIGHEFVDDPEVSRIFESFAFLAAKLRLSLDDCIPQVLSALMDANQAEALSSTAS